MTEIGHRLRLWAMAMTLALFTGGPGGAEQPVRADGGSGLAETLTDLGVPVPLGATVALTFFGNERQQRAGRQAADALVVTIGAAELLKRATREGRPDDPQARDGFPSRHAAVGFAFARSLSSQYPGWGRWAYLFAAGVTWSRVETRDHTWAQALAGAGLGWYVADRSLHSRGGLLNGLIVKQQRPALAPAVVPGQQAAEMELWRAVW